MQETMAFAVDILRGRVAGLVSDTPMAQIFFRWCGTKNGKLLVLFWTVNFCA